MRGRKKLLKTYINEKIKLLKELKIKINDEQIEHLYSLTNEIAVDNFVHDIITDRERQKKLEVAKETSPLMEPRGYYSYTRRKRP